jgi:hypothetical protein
LAQVLNLAAARWDIGGAHAFVLRDGRRVAPVPNDGSALDEALVKVGALLREGDEFQFELTSNDRRRCRVIAGNTEIPVLLEVQKP